MNENLIEILENRRAMLKEQLDLDRKCFNDPFLSQHSRGRVAVEEYWLKETERLLELLMKHDRG